MSCYKRTLKAINQGQGETSISTVHSKNDLARKLEPFGTKNTLPIKTAYMGTLLYSLGVECAADGIFNFLCLILCVFLCWQTIHMDY